MIQIAAGQLLGRYELLVPIAKGGMAQVWAARLKGSRGFHKLVAIKTVLPRALDDQKLERMFLEEAELASQIHHPNVVETLELGEQDGILYLVMDWVDGEPLSEVIAKAREHGGLPLGVAINLIGQALKGLSAAHTARDENGMPLGLVHRDISPQNVLITYAGMAKLVDFGIAKATSRASSLTELGEIKGKFAYMAPEQVRGDVVDARTDVFSMGILLYVITCGRHPYKGETPAETISRISSPDGPTPPSQWLPGYPPDLEAVLLKALAPAAADRYSTAYEMLIALERALPEAFELSAEIRVAEYVKGLLADRATQRRTTIRMAKEFIERSRGESSSTSSSSFSSLRGIAIEQAPSSASMLVAASAGMPSNTGVTPISNRVPTNTEVVAPKPRAQRRWPMLIGALAVATIAAVALVRATAPAGGPATVAAAPAPVVAPPSGRAEEQPQRKADEALDSKGAADAAGNSTADAEAAPESADSDRQRAAQRGWRRAPRAAKRPSGAAATTTASAGAASSTPSAEAVREAPSRPTSKDGNAWDPGSFGGRQ